MDCDKFRDLLSPYIDGLLNEKEKEELQSHLAACTLCQQELKSLQDMSALLKDMDELTPPEGFRREIINKLQGTKPEEVTGRYVTKAFIKEKLRKLTSSKMRKISSLAAGLLILFGLTYFIQVEQVNDIQSISENSLNRSMYGGVANSPMANSGNIDSGKLGRSPKSLDKLVYSGKNKTDVAGTNPANYDRKVVKNGSMEIETKEFDKTLASIDIILQKVQGYYENKNINSQGETKNGILTLRIPAPKFLDVTAQIEKLGKINNKSITGNDVTTEYYDTKARIKVLKAQEDRLLSILKKAKNVDEILSVENELSRIRQEIEINEGRMKVLDNNIGMSTLNLEITEVKEINHITPPGIKGTLLRSWQAFIGSVNSIIKLTEDLVIFLGGALPFLAIIALCTAGYIYYRKRKAKK